MHEDRWQDPRWQEYARRGHQPERNAEIHRRVEKGEAMADIARDKGLHHSRVWQIHRQVEARLANGTEDLREQRKERNRRIRERVAAGETQRDVADDVGLNYSYVSRIVRGHRHIGERR